MKKFSVVFTLLVLALVLTFGSRAAALCAAPTFSALLLTPVTASIPRSSGALVAGVREVASSDGSSSPSFAGAHLTRGRRIDVPFQAIEIAPSLMRLVPTSRLRPGAYTLEGLGAPVRLTVGRAPMPGAPVRPAVSGVRRVASVIRGGVSVEIRAALSFPIPTGIVAVITYWGDASSPSVWSPAVLGQTEVLLFGGGGRCGGMPPGFTPPPSEGPLSVRIAFVDQFGQVSPESAVIPVE